jgi:hypothetical protein
MKQTLTAGLLIAAGCSSSNSSEPFTACTIGELRGTWRVTYAETDGTCGKVPSETVVLMPGNTKAASACTFATDRISPDRCRLDLDFTCPLTAPTSGSQHWVGALRQTSPTNLSGSMTLQVTTGAVTCRSTYDIDYSQQ